MFIRQFSEGEPFRCAGNEFVMLLPRDETGACEAVLQMVRPGGTTPPNSHETFMQIYLSGRRGAGVYRRGDAAGAGSGSGVCAAAHRALGGECAGRPGIALSLHQRLAGWDSAEEREGGWKNVYAKIIDSYVSRGYPVDGK